MKDGEDQANPLMCSQTEVSWSHIDLSPAGPIQGISYLILVFANQRVLKVIVVRNVTQLSSTRFEDIHHSLNISLPHSPPNLNGQDEQLIGNVPDEASFWYPNLGALSKTSPFSTKPTKIYLDACDPPLSWNPETPEIQRNHRPNRYSRRLKEPQKSFKVDPLLIRMEKKLPPEVEHAEVVASRALRYFSY
ncbi:hypothetical protein ACTXT7_008001 [Hymenolepis weldensis]